MQTGLKVLLCSAVLSGAPAWAADSYLSGHITNITFAGADVYIALDAGLPTNCAGSPFGWMVIPASAKATQAFVIGLRLRSNLSDIPVTVYTDDREGGTGYCQINQLDPAD
jgi:hypothetical protein